MNAQPRPYRGRFAPSPTGELHFGSLVAAVGSFLQARARSGRWLVRIEDIDPPREVAGAARNQLKTLQSFGLVPDEPAIFQRQLGANHQQALDRLLATGHAFPCGCSRSDLPADGIYPGTCRGGLAADQTARSIRLRVDDDEIAFVDGLQGTQRQNPARQSGDFVIRRADGLVAYQLAVVVDDAAAGISEVVRGADLIDSTGRQLHLYRCLDLPAPDYVHLPIVVNEQGEKLSKSNGADPIQRYNTKTSLRLALRALGHEPPASIMAVADQLAWAQQHWQLTRVPTGQVAIGVQTER